MDTQFFLEVNRAARDSAWAHGAMRLFATSLALALLGVIVLVALVRAWRDRFAGERSPRLVHTVAVVIGALASYGLAELLAGVIARPRPYAVLTGVEVLVARVATHPLPSAPVAVAAAAAMGLGLAGDRIAGAVSAVLAIALAYARIYVGAEYPTDVLAGIGLGIVVATAVVLVSGPLVARLAPERAASVPDGAARRAPAVRSAQAGPAAQPTAIAPSGAVRVLSDHTIRPAGSERTST